MCGKGNYRRALAIYERSLGGHHPDVANCLNNIGSTLQDQGKPTEAETHYRRALAIGEKTFGPDHPWVATGLNNVGTAAVDPLPALRRGVPIVALGRTVQAI